MALNKESIVFLPFNAMRIIELLRVPVFSLFSSTKPVLTAQIGGSARFNRSRRPRRPAMQACAASAAGEAEGGGEGCGVELAADEDEGGGAGLGDHEHVHQGAALCDLGQPVELPERLEGGTVGIHGDRRPRDFYAARGCPKPIELGTLTTAQLSDLNAAREWWDAALFITGRAR